MKIVILTMWYSEKMGYAENCLPRSLAKLGHEVHVISSVCQVYYNHSYYRSVYYDYLGKEILEPEVKETDGFTLHRLPFGTIFDKIYLKGLNKRLKEIKPDILQTFDTYSLITLQAAYFKLFHNYKLFTANHVVASIFPLLHEKKNSIPYHLYNFFIRYLPGRLVSSLTSRCYPATIDACEIAVKYFGIPESKVKLSNLGVDTDLFKPGSKDTDSTLIIQERRRQLGIDEKSVVCIYTGRFTPGKNPLILAEAIDILASEGYEFSGLFIGDGPQAESIITKERCLVIDFKPYHELPKYYAIADIGVWPQQESTSMLDASACGLPIIISNRVQATERVEGNGLTYVENDVQSLVASLKKLNDSEIRKKLGIAGARKITEKLSWDIIAKERADDYKSFIAG